MENKLWYESKVLWINLIGILYVIFGKNLGVDFTTPEMTAMILTVVNIVLRFVTKKEVTLS